MTIFYAILIFTIIILVHELGHFWAARKAGIHVVEFSLGMGPRLLKFTDKKGTMFSLKLFPIGGSCRMLGEDEAVEGEEKLDENGEAIVSDAPPEPNPRSFGAKSVWWRMIVILGGAAMNFALAFVLASIISMFNVQSEPTVVGFSENSPAQAAGMLEGDRILRLNGRRIVTRGDITLAMLSVDGNPIETVVERSGERLTLAINPIYLEAENRWLIGISHFGMGVGVFHNALEGYYEMDGVRRMGFFEGFQAGYQTVGFYIRATFTGLGRMIRYGLNFDELMGPIGIVDTVGGQVAEAAEVAGGGAAFWTLLSFTVLLSANLGVMNLLPIPALDGGRMIFLTIEAIRKKPIPPEREAIIHFAGFVLLMGLILVVAYNDIIRLF